MTTTRHRRDAVLIAGPTASGKSALALALAERLGGVIINADSAQVYAELRIITARPTTEDEARAEHRLYGYRPAAKPFSVAEWLADVERVLADLRHAGRPAIIVGGTGLYFRALTEGLVTIPDIAPEIRAYWRGRAEVLDAASLHKELARQDPVMAARLRPSDAQRIARALEVVEATGRSLDDWQRAPNSPPLLAGAACTRVVVEVDRAVLHARINARFEAMVAGGAIAEARTFAALQVEPSLPSARAIGVRPLLAAVNGDIDVATAIAAAQAESRQYAKRQVTWQRHQMVDWLRIPQTAPIDDVLLAVA